MGDVEKPVIQRFDILLSSGIGWRGGKLPACTRGVLARKGPAGCPARSLIGTGSGFAYADDILTRPKITIVNGGAHDLYLYTVLTNPARVQAPIPLRIRPISGKWALRLTGDVPRNLQIVAGVPIALRNLRLTTRGFATSKCPSEGRWPVVLETFLSTGGSVSKASTTPCLKARKPRA